MATADDHCQVVAVGGRVAETGASTLSGRLRLFGHPDSLLARRLEGSLSLLCRNYGYVRSPTYIGLTAAVTHGREPFRQLAEGVPLQRLLLETDAPYFVPAGDYHSFSRPSCAFEGKVASRQECHPERCDDVWTVGLYMVCCI